MASLGFAPRSQWRDRAGLSPASLRAPAGPGPDGVCRPRPGRPGTLAFRILPGRPPGSNWRDRRARPRLTIGPVAWARISVALILALSLLPRSPARDPTAPTRLRLVAAAGVRTLLPPRWEFRPIPDTGVHRLGIQASGEALGMIPADLRHPGLEAYWVDATEVGVPTDYYELAARGPLLDLVDSVPGCRTDDQLEAVSPRHAPGPLDKWPGQYVTMMTGTCHTSTADTRWASFVAAPGFGPARKLGIPSSGLYVVRAAVPDGPDAERSLRTLMSGVSFGGTPVGDFLAAAGLPPRLP